MNNVAVLVSFGCFIAIFPIVGALANRRSTGTEGDYLLGGRSFGKFVVGLSAGAATVSGFLMIAAVGLGYTMGVSALLVPIFWFVGDLIFWTFFPGKINRLARELNCYTVPELLSSRARDDSGLRIQSIAAVIAILSVGLYAAAQLLAAGKTLAGTLQIDITTGILFAAIVVVSYCAKGGLRASMWNNFIQANMMLVTCIGMLIAAIIIGGGPRQIVESLRALDPDLLDITTGFSQGPLILAAVGWAGAAFTFDLSAPQFLVRLAAGRDPDEMRHTKWIFLSFVQVTWFCMTLFGVIMRIVLPDLLDPEQALPLFASLELNSWLVGAVMAGVFSAILSTLDAVLLVIASAVAVDVAPRLHQRLTERFGASYRVMTTVFVAIILVVVAISVDASMFDLVVFSSAGMAGAFAPTLLVLLLNLRTSAAAVKTSMLTGLTVAIVWRAAGLSGHIVEAIPGVVAGLLAHFAMVALFSERPARG